MNHITYVFILNCACSKNKLDAPQIVLRKELYTTPEKLNENIKDNKRDYSRSRLAVEHPSKIKPTWYSGWVWIFGNIILPFAISVLAQVAYLNLSKILWWLAPVGAKYIIPWLLDILSSTLFLL